MREVGAYVIGHRARVRGGSEGSYASCPCGWQSQVTGSVDNSCLALVDHLQQQVRYGARVARGDDGTAGVREPRRPLRPAGTAGAVVDRGRIR